MNGQHVPEVVIVDLAVGTSFDGGVRHVEDAGNLEDRIVGFLGEVQHALRVEFPGQVEAVHIALGATRGDVAPSVVGVQSGELGEVEYDLSFELVGVAPVVGLVEGVSDVVEAVAEEWYERGVVEVLVARVAHLPLVPVLDFLEEFCQAAFDVVLSDHGCFFLGVFKRTVSETGFGVGDAGNYTLWAARCRAAQYV